MQTDDGFGGTYLEEFTIYVNDVPFDGDDDLFGTPKNDTIDESTGNDTIRGGGGNDLLLGGEDNDKLVGNGGNDALKGESGNDFLFGGNGVDELTGGSGKDVITGNNGADKFIFDSPTDGIDVIKDFRGLQQGDRIVLNTSNFTALDPGSLSADNFVKGNKAVDGDDYLIYNNSNNIPNGHLF